MAYNAEFGDERDAKTREFLERIAPLNNAKNNAKKIMSIEDGILEVRSSKAVLNTQFRAEKLSTYWPYEK